MLSHAFGAQHGSLPDFSAELVFLCADEFSVDVVVLEGLYNGRGELFAEILYKFQAEANSLDERAVFDDRLVFDQ